jgi:hypothetical protein
MINLEIIREELISFNSSLRTKIVNFITYLNLLFSSFVTINPEKVRPINK